MIASGLRATLTCVDPKQLDPEFLGRSFGEQLLVELPATVDPCGERGEFHTFCNAGPMFDLPIDVVAGEQVKREGYWFADLVKRPTRSRAIVARPQAISIPTIATPP